MTYGHAAISNPPNIVKLDKSIAYRQAGHAVGICLGNRLKQLPPVYFQVTLTSREDAGQINNRYLPALSQYNASVEGGRLVQYLPSSFAEATRHLTWAQRHEYQCAFDADVANLLAGIMAEAYYFSQHEGVAFNANLVYQLAQSSDGGRANMDLINGYLKCWSPDQADRQKKLADLFLATYRFVNEPSNWQTITFLADYLWGRPTGVVPCEDIIALVDSFAGGFTKLCQSELPGFFMRRKCL
ncbi:MAG: hypothetical protein HOO93_04195 [Methyloglobulus sp.]|nr:hypothetical protein [Methyloglobulus sp.]